MAWPVFTVAVELHQRVAVAVGDQSEMPVGEWVLARVDAEIVEQIPEIDLVLAALEVVDRVAAEIVDLVHCIDPIEEDVLAGATVQNVGTEPALQHIVACIAA